MKDSNEAKTKLPTERGFTASAGSAIPMWLVMTRDGKDDKWRPCAAYATKIQAAVYASGCSDPVRMKIIAGVFSPNDQAMRPEAEQ